MVAFIDIEGAFNNVTANSIMEALRDKKVDPGVCSWVNPMLTRRIVLAEVAGWSVTRAVSRTLKKIELTGATVSAHADYLSILVRGKFPSVLSELIEGALWTVKGLGVNADETELVYSSVEGTKSGFLISISWMGKRSLRRG